MHIKQPQIKKASSTSLGRKEGKRRNVKPVTSIAEAIHVNLLPALSHPMAGSYRQASLTRIQQMYGNQFVQRMMMNHTSEALKIQRQPQEEEEPLQTKGASGEIPKVNPGLETRINASRGSGQPLSKSVCSFFETRFGHDFSQVRIHTDAPAAESTRMLKARAFTIGRDVVFGAGQYAPETIRGKRLLAHELTHVVQQKASTSLLLRQVEEALREELPVPKFPPIFGTGKFTYQYAGKKVLTGANAKWVGIPSIKHHIEKKGGKWYGVLDKFHIKANYWINSKTKWDHIKNFPGGSYKHNFNTPEGSKTHERAELKAVKTLWETAQKNIKAGIKKGFKTKKEAVDNYKKIFNKEMKNFRKKQQAISDHTNPVGPNAEWAYYKKEYAKYKASLKTKKAPKKKTP